MVRGAARTVWNEPRAPGAPARVWRDWAIVGALIPAALIETALRDDLVWRPFTALAAVGVLLTLLWRRTHPLLMVAIVFGTSAVVDLAGAVRGVTWEMPASTAAVLLLPYALLRWGSGREAVMGVPLLLLPVAGNAPSSPQPVEEIVGGTIVVLLAAAIGAAVRFQRTSRSRAIEGVQLREREQIARELHDTVAHHVSAIAIQAQAGRALGETDPEAALGTLAVIEEEASRTLAEMRRMVGALRRDDAPEFAPRSGVADIARLAQDAGGPPVHVELDGDLRDLPPSLDAALYRLAQESVTNAVRHARDATRIDVRVTGEPGRVRLAVRDDGRGSPPSGSPGYGLAGMRERATLLGGSLTAGPAEGGGWGVEAVLPRDGAGA